MSKLWIVHRQARRRVALARLAGLAPSEVEAGAPTSAAFAEAAPPTALLLGLEDDFEPELEFLHRHRSTLEGVRRLFVVRPEDVDEAVRLTGARPDEIVAGAPDPRRLRAFLLSARAHRRAEPLAARRDRERIARRFSTWFGELDLPGLMRTLDPSLAAWPLLVRGAPGSGRSLVARYVERYRVATAPGPTLRVDARTIVDVAELDERRRAREARADRPVTTIWIDELDALPPSVQRGLAEWIRFGVGPDGPSPADLRWVATAGPSDASGLHDRLEPILVGAFAPLIVVVPALADRPEALALFAERVVAEWAERAGGLPRLLSDEALDALEAHAWAGDRAAVEALLRGALAATARETILASDLATTPEDGSVEDTGGAEGSRAEDERIGAEAFARAPEIAPVDAVESGEDGDGDEDDESYDDAYGEEYEGEDDEEGEEDDEEPYDDAEEPHEDDGTPIVDAAPGDEPGLLEAAFLEGLEPPVADAAASGGEGDDGGGGEDHSTHDGADEAPFAGTALTPEGDVSSDLASESFRIAASGRGIEGDGGDPRWRRLARSLSHEIRNPLVSIKTFTELLPEHFEDDAFRERFTELVGRDVAHIDEVIGRLARAAEGGETKPGAVDVSAMIEGLLDARRETVGRRRLLVLQELERDAPLAWAEPNALEGALSGLIDRALASLPERGDLFIATRHIDRGPDGTPRLRVLLRHHHPELGGGDRSGVADVGAASNAIEYVLAETIVESAGGQLTIDTTDARETLILVDLRTPE